MYKINPMPTPLERTRLARLDGLRTSQFGQFLHGHVMHPEIRALLPGGRAVGTAVTVRIPGPDGALLQHALGLARAGDILVIDRCGDRKHAAWGLLHAAAARRAGVAGVIIDGFAADPQAIRDSGVPVWALGLSPVMTKNLALGGALNAPVSVGGVAVHPGDAVLADDNGVLILPPSVLDGFAAKGQATHEREAEVLRRVQAGEALGTVTGASTLIDKAPKVD